MLQAVVVHSGNRDHYQVALALHEADLLEKLVTDVYFPLDQPWFMRTFGRLVPMDLLAKRYCPGLPSEKVSFSAQALGVITVHRLLQGRKNLLHLSDALLGRKARNRAIHTQSAVFSYSTYASEAFKISKSEKEREKLPCLLFQMHPHPARAQQIIREELLLTPKASSSLLLEYESNIPARVLDRLVAEPKMADTIVVASNFCKSTITEHGIPAERVHLVPYGINPAQFPEKPPGASQTAVPLKLIFLGNIIQRKGISYLLEAMKLLSNRPVKLVLCGRQAPDIALIEQYKDCDVEIKLGLPHDQIIHELHRADVFVFPSLLEGFAHVILEAMSCGLPVITTPHTCGPDVITNGKHGFIVPVRDSNALAEKILWALAHRDQLAEMGRSAAIRAREFTWERFRAGIREAYVSALSPQ